MIFSLANVSFAQTYGYTASSPSGNDVYGYSALPTNSSADTGSIPGDVSGAQTGDMSNPSTANSLKIPNPLGNKSITDLVQGLLDVVMVFAIPIVVFFIIYAGFMYVTARGNESTIQKAHMALLYALIGGILILGARVLIDVLQGTVDSVIH